MSRCGRSVARNSHARPAKTLIQEQPQMLFISIRAWPVPPEDSFAKLEIKRVEIAGERIVPDRQFLLDLRRELEVIFKSA